jgi:hypothetical protein
MKNRELFLKDPVQSELLNNGVAEVRDIQSQSELQTLRYELETFRPVQVLLLLRYEFKLNFFFLKPLLIFLVLF